MKIIDKQDRNYDLLVLGAGMSGLTTATRAIQEGLRVLVVEKGSFVGGSANYAGFIWTAPDEEVMAENNPLGNQTLAGKIARDYNKALSWVKALEVDIQDPVQVLRFGRGCQTDLAQYFRICEKTIVEKGELIFNATTNELIVESGKVVGAEISLENGETRRIWANNTVLATGGFGGDALLRAEKIHPLAANMPVRANRNSKGDGLRMATSLGASSGPGNAGFYGHLMPSQIAVDEPMDFVTLSFYHSEHSVLLNTNGERFCDETIGDHITTLEVLEQPEARALMIYDQRTHDEWMMKPYVKGANVVDRFQVAYKRGARCAVADSLDDFSALPEEWGYPGERVVQVLQDYNAQCGKPNQSPARTFDVEPLIHPPFYVIEVIPAITFTFDGLFIDSEARVLDKYSQPIPGLLAAGADVGGIYVRAYAGGIASALVFGLQAAETAVAHK